MAFSNARSTERAETPSPGTTRIVLSPATVPATPVTGAVSMASARALAAPGGVRTSSSRFAATKERANSWRACRSRFAGALERPRPGTT
jgi:hypothetical protein